ncbi:MAG: hypothetical protein IT353_21605 [Gemmatimonadaceae bacterium]|nr:hypothetical protein [Gemmatimonadaceae bacterium]
MNMINHQKIQPELRRALEVNGAEFRETELVVRCDSGSTEMVMDEIVRLGGHVHKALPRLGAIAVALNLGSLETLASIDGVIEVRRELTFAPA